jgi:ribonuclease HII
VRYQLKKMSLKRMAQLIQERGIDFYPEVIAILEDDPRGGAQRLVRLCRERLLEWDRQKDLFTRLTLHERSAREAGATLVAGVSEVGRGPVAGPVVAAAVILPPGLFMPGLSEVRRLSAKRRLELATQIRTEALAISTRLIQPDGADEGAVIRAIYQAMTEAVVGLPQAPDHLLVDGLHVPHVRQAQTLVVDGEEASASIAAAQVIARVTRDQYMEEMDRIYPQYGFASHKGYGTVEHREAIRRYGPSPIHRGPLDYAQMAAAGQLDEQD